MNQDVARFAVKCGMWGVVKNMDGGFRKFQRDREARRRAARAADDEARRRASTSRESIGTVETRTVRGGERVSDAHAMSFVVGNGTEATFGGRAGATLTRASAAALRFVAKPPRRPSPSARWWRWSTGAARWRSGRARARRERARAHPRRGRAGARGAQALDPGEVEAAVGKVLDERLANLGGLVDFVDATSEATRAAESETEERADVQSSAGETVVEATARE